MKKTAKPKRGRGRPPRPGMVTKSLRFPEDLVESLEAIASELTDAQPVDRSPILWTDVVRDMLRDGVTDHGFQRKRKSNG